MHNRVIRIVVVIFAINGICLLTGCSSSSWDDVKQANTYKAYQSYINNNPKGKHIGTAKNRADSLYWTAVKNDTTAQPFKKYLKTFPKGQFRAQAQLKIDQISRKGRATRGRVTGSGVIIRSDHTTESASKGVVANKGTVVQILDQYSLGNGDEAILKHDITVKVHGSRISLAQGKAIQILADRNNSVEASFKTSKYGLTKAAINKDDIEAIGDQKWYKIHTTDNITGWIYGKFIQGM